MFSHPAAYGVCHIYMTSGLFHADIHGGTRWSIHISFGDLSYLDSRTKLYMIRIMVFLHSFISSLVPLFNFLLSWAAVFFRLPKISGSFCYLFDSKKMSEPISPQRKTDLQESFDKMFEQRYIYICQWYLHLLKSVAQRILLLRRSTTLD